MTVSRFTAIRLPQFEDVGGKGWSLLRMGMAGLPVPPTVILGVDFFAPWITQLQSIPAWQAVQVALQNGTDLHPVTAELQVACTGLQFSEDQQRQLDATVEQRNDLVMAVRSSAPEEDLAGASFAGGYETSLGVTAETLPDAVRHSFASAFDQRVFVYKQQHGFATDQPRIAVVVQTQIAADVAGVGFSLNPITNDYDEAVIDANWGLGESVVAGQTSPDHFVVDKVDQTITRQLGGKESSVWLAPDGGTTARPGPRRDAYCLTDTQLRELLDLIGRVEELYRQPMDIEWAYADGQLHLLQARPITAYVPIPATMQTRPGERRTLYLDAALTEGVTTNRPMAPLTLDWLFESMSILGSELLGRIRTPADADPTRSLIFAAGGRYYGNLSHILTLVSSRRLSRWMRTVDVLLSDLLGGTNQGLYAAPEKPAYLRWPTLLVRLPRAVWRSRRLIGQTLSAVRNPERFYRHHEQVVDQTVRDLGADVDPATSLAELIEWHGRVVVRAWTTASFPALLVYFFYQGRLNKLFAGGSEDQKHLLDAIEMGLPGNEAVELGVRLYEMSQLLRPDDFADLDHLAHRIEQRDLSGEFLSRWDGFVARYGFRGPGELELTNSRYGEDPRLALEQMSSMTGSDVDPAATQRRHVHERETAYDELLSTTRGSKRTQFTRAYTRVSMLGPTRDTPKYLVVLANGAFRRQALIAGERLVTQDRLDTPEHVFDLTVDELDHADADASVDLRQIRADRRPFYDQVDRVRSFPHLIDSRGRIGQVNHPVGEPGVFTGLGISRGTATGPVKVLHTAREKPIEKGDVLVAYTTDPGWTPLFVNAAAVILEVGGMLQHGGVVAREYGKPCVAGIQGITTVLEDGQLVEVDGTTGIVRFLNT